MMVYLYNPTICPQILGRFTFAPNNYSLVDEDTAKLAKSSGVPVILESEEHFPPLWLTWPDTDSTRKLL